MTDLLQKPTASAKLPFWRGLGVVIALELRQRVHAKAWYMLLVVYLAVIAVVTIGLVVALDSPMAEDGTTVFSALICFVLLLASLVTPALGGNAINGDRDAGTLATTQVTLVTTGQIVLGKFVAAWAMALVFLVAAVPFLFASLIVGPVPLEVIGVSVLVLAAELGVIAAIGVGLSGLLIRPLFSIVVTYLMVALLGIGSLIGFGILTLVDQSEGTLTYTEYDWKAAAVRGQEPSECFPTREEKFSVPRPDHYWMVLTLNPYVVLADATPTSYTQGGDAIGSFGLIKSLVRGAQIPPVLDRVWNDCDPSQNSADALASPPAREVIESTTPGWFVGLTLHVLLSAGLLAGAHRRSRTPAKKLPQGSRIA